MAKRTGQERSNHRDNGGADTARYWSKRLKRVSPLAAVLTYNAPEVINQAYDRWERTSLIRHLPASMNKKSALDLGCGTGRVTLALAKTGARVTGVDISSAMLQACRVAARSARVSGRLTLVEASVAELSHDLGKFDLITCFGLLEHLTPDDRQRCMEAAFANLKKSGRILVVVNNSDSVYLKARGKGPVRRIKGHYVSMVGLPWLERISRAHGAAMTLLAANPFYAWLHYGIVRNRLLTIPEAELTLLATTVERLDLAFPLEGPLPDGLASHFMVELRRR